MVPQCYEVGKQWGLGSNQSLSSFRALEAVQFTPRQLAGSGTSLGDAQTGSPPRLDKVSFNTEILGHSSKHMGKHSGLLFIQRSASEVYLRGLEVTSPSDMVIHLEER